MKKSARVCAGVLGIAVLLLLPRMGCGQALFNYDNDPDLTKAMYYDTELCAGDYDRADRELAVKHYLAYLGRCKDSFQRARVYYELGVMHSTAINRKKDEKPDLEKARSYFQKCLEEEPERIGGATCRARTQLASLHQHGSARIRARMDVYEWFLTINEAKVRALWLPLRPGEVPTERRIAIMAQRTKGPAESTAYNMVSDVKSGLKIAAFQLAEIVRRFPGTYAAKLVKETLEEFDEKWAMRIKQNIVAHSPGEGEDLVPFRKGEVTTKDLLDVTGINLYKFRLDIRKGERLRLTLREFPTKDSKGKELYSVEFEKEEEEATTLRIAFLRDDRRMKEVLLSEEEWMELRVRCSGCSPRGVVTNVPVPLSKASLTKRSLFVVPSEERSDTNDRGETQLLYITCRESEERKAGGVEVTERWERIGFEVTVKKLPQTEGGEKRTENE